MGYASAEGCLTVAACADVPNVEMRWMRVSALQLILQYRQRGGDGKWNEWVTVPTVGEDERPAFSSKVRSVD